MKPDTSLRSAATQLRYQQAMEDGMTRDISKLKGTQLGGLKIIENAYSFDTMFKDNNDMLLDQSGNFWDWWIKLGQLYIDGRLPYDGFWLNNHHKKSQPQVEHIHGLYFKPRDEFKL